MFFNRRTPNTTDLEIYDEILRLHVFCDVLLYVFEDGHTEVHLVVDVEDDTQTDVVTPPPPPSLTLRYMMRSCVCMCSVMSFCMCLSMDTQRYTW